MAIFLGSSFMLVILPFLDLLRFSRFHRRLLY